MKCSRFILTLAALLLGAMAATSCVTTYSGSYDVPDIREVFPELPNAKLRLEVIGSRDFMNGLKKELRFRLTNYGGNQLFIEEWFRSEERNITIYYQDWTPDMKEPDPRLWMVWKPYTPPLSVRAPLSLSPGTSADVKVPAAFLDGITVSEGYERRFFVRAELNLMSVKASTPVFAVTLI